ncbi:MAG: ABC transporter, permease protein [Microgenomates bacterium 39_6]|nr:MAG: ABC transporter, permease protein [Microgenomates bacterium 39_6]
MSTIYIMWLRQLKRYWRSKSRIIGSIGQPLLFLVSLGFGMNSMYHQTQGGSYINFLAPGVMIQAVLFMAIFNGIELIWDKEFGFLKETLAAPVSRLEIVIGRVLGGATIALIQGLIVFSLTLLLGFRPYNWWLLPLAAGLMFLVALLYSALGTGIASTLKDFHGFQLIMNFLVMPSFFLSGALFPLENTPPLLQTIAKINPLTYGVDGLRQLMLGTTYLGLGTDLLVLGILATVLVFISSYLFTRIEV